MGKAALQRRIKRMRYLARLASEEPDRFEVEWEKRLSSWCEQIGKNAGKLKDRESGEVSSVFELVNEALAVLNHCGEKIYRRYADKAFELLTGECCSHFSRRVDPRLFRVNHYHNPL